jgi:nucleolar protein 56
MKKPKEAKLSKKEKLRLELIEKAKKGVEKAFSSKEVMVTQTINLLSDLEKIINLIYMRLSNWEQLYAEIPTKNIKNFFEISKKIASGEEVKGVEVSSINLEKEDLEEIKSLAELGLRLIEEKERKEKYLQKIVNELYPNLSYILPPKIVALLIEKAGGVEKLALMPSSTIQLLGAEKALFKHLKFGTKAPKHGFIFQHPFVSSKPKKLRGRAARILANKIAIAARADAFSKNFIAKKLKEELDKAKFK